MSFEISSPVALHFGGFSLYWYAVAYLLSFIWLRWQTKQLIARADLWGSHGAPEHTRRAGVLILFLAVGVVLGARVSYVVEAYGQSIPTLSQVRAAGMSSDGSFIGAVLCLLVYCRLFRVKLLGVSDLICVSAPLCVFIIRCANLLNGDIPGTPLTHPLFQGGPAANPAALYEAILEGLIPFVVLRYIVTRRAALSRPGLTTGLFGLMYATTRLVADTFRSDAHLSTNHDSTLIFTFVALVSFGTLMAAFINPRPQRIARNNPTRSSAPAPFVLEAGETIGFLILCVPLTGCAAGPIKNVPNIAPADPVKIVTSDPNIPDPNCPCENSTAAYAQNSSAQTRTISWMEYVKDTSSGQHLNPIPGGPETVPPSTAAGPGSLFLGCTVYAPPTSCRFQAVYELTQESAQTQNAGIEALIFGGTSSPSLGSCRTLCASSLSPSKCLFLGERFFQAVAPLLQAIQAANAQNGTVTKADVLRAYHRSPSDDKCDRGNITRVGNELTNYGKKDACTVSSMDVKLPSKTLQSFGVSLADSSKPLKMFTTVRKKVVAEIEPSIDPLDSNSSVVFKSISTAPIITFDGAAGAELTRDFGGFVLGAAEVPSGQNAKRTIVATTNGCIAVDEPHQ